LTRSGYCTTECESPPLSPETSPPGCLHLRCPSPRVPSPPLDPRRRARRRLGARRSPRDRLHGPTPPRLLQASRARHGNGCVRHSDAPRGRPRRRPPPPPPSPVLRPRAAVWIRRAETSGGRRELRANATEANRSGVPNEGLRQGDARTRVQHTGRRQPRVRVAGRADLGEVGGSLRGVWSPWPTCRKLCQIYSTEGLERAPRRPRLFSLPRYRRQTRGGAAHRELLLACTDEKRSVMVITFYKATRFLIEDRFAAPTPLPYRRQTRGAATHRDVLQAATPHRKR